MGVGEAGSLAGNQEVAPEGQLEAAGDGGPIDGTDDWGGVIGEHAESSGLPLPALGGRLGELGPEVAQIEAGAERRVGSGEDHGSDPILSIECLDHLAQVDHELG